MALEASGILRDQRGYLVIENEEGHPSRHKRAKVGLACQRCKTRKKKCDGSHPCNSCKISQANCEYVIPPKAMPFGKNQYIKSLEHRVAELEALLARHGMPDLDSDHWKAPSVSNATSVQWEATQSEGKSTSSSSGNPEIRDPDAAVLDWQDGADSVLSILRSLSLDVNGSGYIGASSYMAMGKLLPFLNGRGRRRNIAGNTRWQSVGSLHAQQFSPDSLQPIDFTDVPNSSADRLFSGYMKHIATQMPIIYSVWAQDVHQRRHSLTNVFEITVLHLIYATAGRFIETTGESGTFHVKRHYVSAVQNLNAILEYDDLRTVQVLMMMAIYCLRDPVGPGAWTCSRIALLVSIEHGLHRQTKALSHLGMEGELRKRLFWACYSFDRKISIPMGRPFGISDRDIDLEFPLDINEDTTNEQLVNMEPLTLPTSTSLTLFLLTTRLRQIESEIQQTIYRVDRSEPIEESVTDEFLARLEEWKSMIPQKSHDFQGDSNYDNYMIYYYKCQRLLLYPLISDPNVPLRFLKRCAMACAGVCNAYRRLHQTQPVGYSFMAVQTIFIAGITLAYCIWISPNEIFDQAANNGIHDCSILLFVITERLPSTKTYRNTFEVIRQRMVVQISNTTNRRSREAVLGLTAELAPSMHSFEATMPFEVDHGGYEQFSQIISDITGEDFFAGMFGPEITNSSPTMLNPTTFWTIQDYHDSTDLREGQ